MRFRLSNAQRKDLLIRGVPLAVALPTPVHDPDDWLEWARRAFCEEGIYVTDVRVDTISVAPPSGGGLTGVIGRIVHDQDANADVLTWGVEVLICDLDPPTKPRESRNWLQWPQYAESRVAKWPAEPAAAVQMEVVEK